VDVHGFRVVLFVSVGVVDELLPVAEVLQEIVGAYEEVLNTVPTMILARAKIDKQREGNIHTEPEETDNHLE
jgi:hypothetical protein